MQEENDKQKYFFNKNCLNSFYLTTLSLSPFLSYPPSLSPSLYVYISHILPPPSLSLSPFFSVPSFLISISLPSSPPFHFPSLPVFISLSPPPLFISISPPSLCLYLFPPLYISISLPSSLPLSFNQHQKAGFSFLSLLTQIVNMSNVIKGKIQWRV